MPQSISPIFSRMKRFSTFFVMAKRFFFRWSHYVKLTLLNNKTLLALHLRWCWIKAEMSDCARMTFQKNATIKNESSPLQRQQWNNKFVSILNTFPLLWSQTHSSWATFYHLVYIKNWSLILHMCRQCA